MRGYNKVILGGNLTKDPEIRYAPSGAAVAVFRIAINRQYKTKEGEKKDEVLFIEVNAWNKLAELCSNYLKKGAPILVDGRLRENRWTDNDGRERSKMFIEANDIVLLPKGDRQFSSFEGDEAIEATESEDDEVPF
ncbi:MAG: single-stranded DNA-binding protein [Candidatus Schekmanbacteria bacterium]|nr:MAG: single-stranded DNA-binding protein [Candidatus Schekmanbacteria bacterium]